MLRGPIIIPSKKNPLALSLNPPYPLILYTLHYRYVTAYWGFFVLGGGGGFKIRGRGLHSGMFTCARTVQLALRHGSNVRGKSWKRSRQEICSRADLELCGWSPVLCDGPTLHQ